MRSPGLKAGQIARITSDADPNPGSKRSRKYPGPTGAKPGHAVSVRGPNRKTGAPQIRCGSASGGEGL